MKKLFYIIVISIFSINYINYNFAQEMFIEEKVADNLLELHNKERTSKEINELKLDKKLCDYAQQHAEYMDSKKRLVHSSMSKLQNSSGAGFVGENIASGTDSEEKVVQMWMKSSGHRKNILNPKYKKIGWGKSKNNYWCVVFTDGE